MAALTPEIVDEVVVVCREAADEIVAALGRSFDNQAFGITIGEATTYDPQQPPDGFDGPGLAVVLKFADASAVALLPHSSGLLPDWYRRPDATGKSRLSTLAQELSMLLVPSSLVADEYYIVSIDAMAETLVRAEVAAGAPLVPLTLKRDQYEGQLSLIWPVAKHGEFRSAVETVVADAAPPAAAPPPVTELVDELAHLPLYTRSFLKVRVPVAVNLASKKLAVKEIMELVPGAIINFDRSCDDLLDLVVCDQLIAAGEVVKVGDKFGLRVRDMRKPQEQFIAITATMSS